MNATALDLATLPAPPQQRRAALIAIASLGVVALVAAPFARTVLGTFPGFVTLYGGAVLMGLAITTTILFGQFALSRKLGLLVLACGSLFSALIFVPFVLTFPGVGTAAFIGTIPATTSAYLWIVWHTALPAAFAAYALLAPNVGNRRVGPTRTLAAVTGTILAAYAAVHLVLTFDDRLPPLTNDGSYTLPIYLVLGAAVLLTGIALMQLLRRANRSVVDAWLTVPAAALLIEALLNGLGGSRYSVGWYFSRIDIVVATTFLVVALLSESNRLARTLSTNERRLRGIVDGVADALVTVDARAAVASVNPAAAALFGFVAEDLTGTPISRILPDYANVAGVAETSVVETVGRDARGTLFPVEFARGRDVTRAFGETIIILRDITQRKAAEEAIRGAAHDRAIEAAEVKSQFLATMSHEIRTPINAVVGMSELLLQTPLSDEAREYATTVRDSADSLLVIVNDILDFSKIEAGRMELENAAFAPVVAVENATDILASAARKKGLALSTYVGPDVPRRVLGDADRLRQVLLNLLGNAVKFTAQGSVTARAVVDADEGKRVVLRFSVTDTGPGIAPEVADHLFEPFRQADQSTRRRFGGTGLGLSISRRLVELMGGKIGFDSSLGRGSTFWFTVPFEPVYDEHEPERSDQPAPAKPPVHAHDDGVSILVAEDNPVNRKLALQQLKKLGYHAHAVADGREAVEAVAHGAYDVVLMDCQMPEVDGFEATREYRRAEAVRGGHVPIIAMTANALEGDREACLAAGMDDYLAKPVQLAALRAAVERFANGVGVAG